jgi:hypothetical protein
MEKGDFERTDDEDGEQNAEIEWSVGIFSNMWSFTI